MVRAVAFLIALIAAVGCQAQLAPIARDIPRIADQTMVIDDRGAIVELLPALRAAKVAEAGGVRMTHQVFRGSEPFSPTTLGVVFNHAMQTRGFITGEIAFKMKSGVLAIETFDADSYPGLAKLTSTGVYEVVARTPAEFVTVFDRLKARSDVEWVEPFIVYGGNTEGGSRTK